MRSLKNQSGSVIIFITLVVVLLLVVVGMGLDTGWVVYSRSMGQRAVDMAALAGAAGVAAGNPAKVKANVETLNTTNDYVKASGNQIDGTVNGNNVTLIHYDAKATPQIQLATGVTGSSVGNANGARVALEQTNPHTGNTSNTPISTPSFLMPLMNAVAPVFNFGSGRNTPASTNVNVSAVAVIESQPSLPFAVNGCCEAVNGILPAGCVSDWTQETASPIQWNQTPSGGSNPNNSGWTTYFDRSVSSPDVIELIDKIAACQGTGGANVGDNICTNNGSQTPDLRELEILIGPNPNEPLCYLAPIIPSSSNFTGCSNTITAFAQICPLAICGPGVNGNKNQNLCTQPNSFGKYVLAKVKSCSITDRNKAAVSQCYSLHLVREPQVGM
ncbi:MAG TPA: pilus assembly protein TadG-related protein [Nitrososphaera sp.]|nr:pilus assembly protein TadG-related protein [Nitrososphaera sp.]